MNKRIWMMPLIKQTNNKYKPSTVPIFYCTNFCYVKKWYIMKPSGSRGIKSLIKWRGKQSLTYKNLFFLQEIIFFKSKPKKKEVQSDLKIKSFFWLLKIKRWKFGDFIDLDPDWSNFVDPNPDTINPDPPFALIFFKTF